MGPRNLEMLSVSVCGVVRGTVDSLWPSQWFPEPTSSDVLSCPRWSPMHRRHLHHRTLNRPDSRKCSREHPIRGTWWLVRVVPDNLMRERFRDVTFELNKRNSPISTGLRLGRMEGDDKQPSEMSHDHNARIEFFVIGALHF